MTYPSRRPIGVAPPPKTSCFALPRRLPTPSVQRRDTPQLPSPVPFLDPVVPAFRSRIGPRLLDGARQAPLQSRRRRNDLARPPAARSPIGWPVPLVNLKSG